MNETMQHHHPSPPETATIEASNDPCPSCDLAKTAGAKFCPQCGANLTSLGETVASPPPACVGAGPACSDSATPEAAVSEHRIETKQTGPPVLGNAQAASVTSIVPSPPRACPCGRPIAEDAAFCAGCGVALTEEAKTGLRLTCVDQQQRSSSRPIGSEPVVIGKDEACDVVIADDEFVSRRHARISRDGDLLMVEDLASRNGTLLRIRRPILIEPGDEILVGTSVLRLEGKGA